MNFMTAIVAGLVGTVFMTLLMMMAPRMGMPKMDVMGMLGTMFTANEGTAKIIGAIIHFMMGAVFGIIYALLWSYGIGSDTWFWGIVFGVVHGLITGMMMPMMVKMNPRSPEMEGGSKALMGMVMGHAVFGLVVALVYAAMT